MNMRKKQVPRHPGEQLLGAKVLGGAVGGGLKNLAGQLFDGQKGVDLKQVGKAAIGGAAGQVPFVGQGLQQAITGGGQQAPTAPQPQQQPQPGQGFFQPQPGGLFNMIQQAHGGMVNYSAGGPTPEQLAEASQILANMGKEEKLAKYGMMSDEAILQEIAKSLDGGEAAPAPYQPEASAPADYLGSDEQKADIAESRRDVETEKRITEKGNRSVSQAFMDEMAQVAAGLRAGSDALDSHSNMGIYTPDHVYAPGSPGYFDAVRRGYNRKEQEHRDRMHSGAQGAGDAYDPLTFLKNVAVGGESTNPGEASFSLSRGIDHALGKSDYLTKPVRQGFGGRVKLRKRY